jgi:hypothetical protein
LAELSNVLWRDIRVAEFLEQLELVAKIADRQPAASHDTHTEEPARM